MKRFGQIPRVILCSAFLMSSSCGTKLDIFDKDSPKDGPKTYGTPFAVRDLLQLNAIAPNINLGMKTYANCSELQADFEDTLKKQWIQQKADLAMHIQSQLEWAANGRYPGAVADAGGAGNSAQPEAASAPAPPAESELNVQERGVDESDAFRVGQHQIFVTGQGAVQVLDRSSLNHIGTIALEANTEAQLFTSGDSLIVMEMAHGYWGSDMPMPMPALDLSSPLPYGPTQSSVRVRIFKTQAGQLPTEVRELKLDGAYADSRLIGKQLVLILNDHISTVSEDIPWSEFANEVWYKDPKAKAIFDERYFFKTRVSGLEIKDETINGLPCSAVTQRKVADFSMQLAKTYSLDIEDAQAAPKALGFVGQGEQIYMTADSLYLLKADYQWFSATDGSLPWRGAAEEKVFIRQVGFDAASGSITPEAEGEVKGRIKDRWALRSLNSGKNLVITTSTGNLWGSVVAQNHLSILEKDAASKSLQIVSAIENFGTREDIRAVRYVGNMVYVVTFRQTDPLFAFDLSDLAKPVLVSGLKIPGFSTYMHPLADGRLLGIGYDAVEKDEFAVRTGIQISLFDTSNPASMSRLDNHVYGSQGSSSLATHDHHAFFYDAESRLLALPLNEFDGAYQSRNGAVVMSFEGDKILEKARISHADVLPAACKNMQKQSGYPMNFGDIKRIYKVDGRLLTLSSYAVKAHALADAGLVEKSTSWELPENRCW